VGDLSKILSEHHLLLIQIWIPKCVLIVYWNTDKYWEFLSSPKILRVVTLSWITENSRYPWKNWECSEWLLKHQKILKESYFYWKIEKAKRPPHGMTATEGGQIASYCNLHGLTTTEAVRHQVLQESEILVETIVTFLAVWSRVALWSDRKMCRILPTASFWVWDINILPSHARDDS
jgi:hypothetical protein